jgi:putative protease
MLAEENRPGEYMELHEDERGSYLMNPKDLNLMPRLNELLALGIDSLKVEGRNKSEYYLGVVTRTYRQAIDDWYQDPENWSYENYLPEFYTIPNRGYTLAFHDGPLHNLGHNYDNTENLSAWEFAGKIKEIREDGFVMTVRNRLQTGDVLEFIPPKSKDTILLRMYEYILAENGTIVEKAHGGGKDIFIPFTQFNLENPESVKDSFQVGELVRKARVLTHIHKDRIEGDITAFSTEINREDPSSVQIKPVERISSQKRPSRLGEKGCCGRGCNGCLIFAHSPIFEKARNEMKKKKIGEMFDRDVRKEDMPDNLTESK